MADRADRKEFDNADAGNTTRDAFINELALKQIADKDPLGQLAAPHSSIGKYGLVTAKGIQKLPEGMWNSVVHYATNPVDLVTTFGAAAAMGAVLKTVLPEGGTAGKIASVAIGAYFTYHAAKPMMEAYSDAGNAVTMLDIDNAATKFGNAGGEFVVGSVIAAGGYKLGAGAAERVLLSERLDGFADSKQALWDGASDRIVRAGKSIAQKFQAGTITEKLGIKQTIEPVKTAGSVNVDPRFELREGTSRFAPSEKQAPKAATLKGEVPAGVEMEATVMLKSKGTDLAMERTLKRIQSGRQGFLTDESFAKKFGASEQALGEVTKFAEQHGLKIAEADPLSGRVVLKGSAGDFSNAFQTRLGEYQTQSGFTFRGREGAIALPNTLQNAVEGVYGLDNRPHARNYRITLGPVQQEGHKFAPRTSKGYIPTEVADAYNFPKNMGEGRSVAIIQLGGGIDLANEAAYYKAHGLPKPEIKVISVGGAKTKTGIDIGADGEVTLDSQIVGAIAPKAQQKVIFAPNSDKGFIDAVTRGTFQKSGELPSSSISISWGAPEEVWTEQGLRGMNQAFKKAALKGISIFAAAGDDGAVDLAPSGRFNVDYPASDPHVTAAGGTSLEIAGGKISSEKVWNGKGATGGGVSERFEVPDYQKNISIPPNANKTGRLGRGVPDISGNADPNTGWRIRTNGVEEIVGGTSAVSPMLAALDARISAELGRNLGPWNPFLYKSGTGAKFYNDIIGGNNNGYPTEKGWDATTGFGSVNGQLLLEAFKADKASSSSIMKNLLPLPLGGYNYRLKDSNGKTS